MALAAAFFLWETRGQVFFSDEWSRYAIYPNASFEYSLHGASGHLIIGNILLYRLVLEVFGADSYLPFRLLAAILSLACAWLFFAYARERANACLAAAAAIMLLFLGAAWEVVATPYGIVSLLPIACGLAALNCLRRRGFAWELAACVFLVAGVASQGFALPFLAGAFVLLAIRENRILPRSAWVVAVPLVLYALWFVWSRTHNADQFIEDPVGFSNIAQVPGTIVALCAVGLSAITGTFRQPSIVEFDLSAGYALLAVLAVVAIIRWQGAAGPPSPRIWVPLVMMLVYGALVGLALSGVRTPTNSRYVYLATLLVLLFGLELSAGRQFSPWAWVACGAVFVAGIGVNVATYRDFGRAIAQIGTENRAVLGALDVAGPAASPGFTPGSVVAGGVGGVADPLGFFNVSYQQSRRRFGSPAFSPQALAAQDDSVAQVADRTLIAAEGIGLAPVGTGIAAQPTRGLHGPGRGAGRPGARGPQAEPRRYLAASGPPPGRRARGAGPSLLGLLHQAGEPPGGGSATITAPRDLSNLPWSILITASQPASVCAMGG